MLIGVNDIVQKRKARRYLCLQRGNIDAQNIRENVQIRDISETGISFFSNTHIQQRSPIVLNLETDKKQTLIPYVIIVRRIPYSQNPIFRNHYGSMFTNLRQDAKDAIALIISRVHKQEVDVCRTLVQKAGLENLADIIQQGRSFLQILLRERNTHDQLRWFTNEIKDYEISSFENKDELSLIVQKLTMHNFHCLLLSSILESNPKVASQALMFQHIVLEKIKTISGFRIELKNLPNSVQIEESKNRLFFSRLDLLKAFIEHGHLDPKLAKKDKFLQSILDEYVLIFGKNASVQLKPHRTNSV